MSTTTQLIAPFATGLVLDIAPWLAPLDGFVEIDNVNVHHGRLQKRLGYRKLADQVHGRTITAFTAATPGLVTVADATGLSDGDTVTLHYIVGGNFPTLEGSFYTIDGLAGPSFNLLDSNGSPVDTNGFGGFVSGVLGTYPGDRIMGLYRFITSNNSKTLLCFDTTRASRYNSTTMMFEPLDTADIMSASDTDYITSVNWQASGTTNRLYFTDGKAFSGGLDGIRYYDGTTDSTVSITPTVDGVNNLNGGKLLFAMRQRLVVLYTYEGTTTYPQRARWSAVQDPSLWNENTTGGGGYVDAPTGEQIISAQLLQNGLVVFFTDSVWLLSPLSDPLLPFRWSRINAYHACDGKMASINFDRYAVSVGQRGIIATDVSESRRIDDRIQLFVTSLVNASEFDKVYGARSYTEERTWLLFPRGTSIECNAALIYDEDSGAFTTYTIAMNVLGYGGVPLEYAFDDFTAENKLDISFLEAGEDTFQDFFWDETSEIFLGGDISGTVYILENGASDNGGDISVSLQTVYWAPFKEEGTESRLQWVDIFIETDQLAYFTVKFFKNNERTPYKTQEFDALPNLVFIVFVNGVTQANPASVNAPSHGLTTGDTIYIYGVRGMDEINGGPYVVTVVNSDNFTLDGVDSTAFGAYSGGGQIVQKEFYRTKVWKRVFAGGLGYQHSMQITQEQTRDWTIDAFKPAFVKTGKRTIG